jgi:hypothetical protein
MTRTDLASRTHHICSHERDDFEARTHRSHEIVSSRDRFVILDTSSALRGAFSLYSTRPIRNPSRAIRWE